MYLLHEYELEFQLGDGDHHIYKEIWTPVINRIVSCTQEHGNSGDCFAVNIIKDGNIVGHVLHEYLLSTMGLLIAELLEGGRMEKGSNFLAFIAFMLVKVWFRNWKNRSVRFLAKRIFSHWLSVCTVQREIFKRFNFRIIQKHKLVFENIFRN